MDANKSFFYNMIFRSIINGNLRSFVIFISILLGSVVSASFINVYLDIETKVTKELNSYGANVIISPKNYEKNSFIKQSELDEDIKNIPNLVAINEYLFGSVSIGPTSAILMGTNFSNLKKVMPFIDVKEGEMINVDFDERNAMIGVDLAKIAGFKLGDEVEISTPGSNQTYKVRIKAIIFDGDKEDNLLIVSLGLAQKILNQQGFVNYANAIINGNYEEISKISQEHSTNEIIFEPISKISKSQGLILDKIKLLMALVGIVVLIITSMCVNTSLSAILLSRLKEIALIRALGASRKNIINLIGSEIFIISICASVIGAFLGFLFAQVLGKILFDSGIDFRIISIVVAVLLSLIFAFFASYYPIKKALNENVANLLRGE